MELSDTAKTALACLDLTNLNDDCTEADIEALCDRARSPHGPVAAICIWPRFVAHAHDQLVGGAVRIATVVNFPAGDAPAGEVMQATREAVADGADEIDMVIPWRGLIEGSEEPVRTLVARVKEAAGGATVKAILETGMLTDDDLIRRAAHLAISGGADFIKTSTGKVPVNASLRAARIMLEEIAAAEDPVGLKPSGGIRSTGDAAAYLELAEEVMGAGWPSPTRFRFGASGLYDALIATLDGADVPRVSEGY
ncbi:MAG: deoxyribose-phosphate aldolase [Pseudomonadota bacterium]